jgi:hypothetical protein
MQSRTAEGVVLHFEGLGMGLKKAACYEMLHRAGFGQTRVNTVMTRWSP